MDPAGPRPPNPFHPPLNGFDTTPAIRATEGESPDKGVAAQAAIYTSASGNGSAVNQQAALVEERGPTTAVMGRGRSPSPYRFAQTRPPKTDFADCSAERFTPHSEKAWL
jgi:hypothetical protein